ncbi:L-rhamnose mutarotase [Sinomicrobium sp. M5D2P17]
MKTIAFKMYLKKGQQHEYRKRHDEIWPELQSLLTDSGIREYHIFLDEENDILFALMKIADNHTVDSLPDHPVMRKWWKFMADIMKTHEDNAPVTKDLKLMFVMP